uniref:Uncharacterized protein n=1 Tax=Romanomermis culicivorax TaxID=13658 RepID=A0A915IRK2_ROMCU
MAMNTRQSKLTGGKTEQYQFTWKIFTGWDYTIGHSETATNTVLANGNKYKTSTTLEKITFDTRSIGLGLGLGLRVIYACLFRWNGMVCQQLETFSLKIYFWSERIIAILWKMTDGNRMERKFPLHWVTLHRLHSVPFHPKRQDIVDAKVKRAPSCDAIDFYVYDNVPLLPYLL